MTIHEGLGQGSRQGLTTLQVKDQLTGQCPWPRWTVTITDGELSMDQHVGTSRPSGCWCSSLTSMTTSLQSFMMSSVCASINTVQFTNCFDRLCLWLWSRVYHGCRIPVADISIRSNLCSAQSGEIWLCHGPVIDCRSFHVAAPVVWTLECPSCLYLRSTSISQGHLRAALKILLFNQAYDILWEHLCLRSMLVLYLRYCGAEQARKLDEREQGMKKYGGAGGHVSGAVSGGYRKRCEQWAEIYTTPTPLTCSSFMWLLL